MKRKILEGTLQNQVFLYRTEDGNEYFQFSYHLMPFGYEVDIHMQPDYGDKNSEMSVVHRIPSSRSEVEMMICFDEGQHPQTLEEVKIFSMDWAELTYEYIQTGVTINDQLLNR